MFKRIDEEKAKFDAIQKANSLDERYKDHPNADTPAIKRKKPLSKYLDNLIGRTKDVSMFAEVARMKKNWNL